LSDSVGKVHLDLETNYGPFQQQLNGIAGKSTNMVMSAFGKMGKVIGGAFAVKQLIDFGKASIDLASDLAEVQNVVDVVFGESSNQINNFAKSALNAYGLSELSAKKYTSTMGAMLKSMGLSQNQVVSMSQSITGLAGDMASFYNLDGDEAFNKIRSGISGETEPLKQLGINMSVANMEAFALSQGITKSYKSMNQAEQALLRYNYLLSVTGDAQGDFARTSDGWANQTRILSEQFNSLKATLGSAFIAALTPVVKMLNFLVAKLQIAAAYFKAFIEAITGVKTETSNASTGVAAGMTDIAEGATEAGDAVEKAAKKASRSLAGFDKLNVLSSSDSGGSGSGGGVGGMDLGSMPEMDRSFPEPDTSGVENATNKVRDMFESLRSYVRTTFAPTITSWGDAFEKLKKPISDATDSVKSSLSDLWNNSLIPFGSYLLEDFVPSIVNTFSETFAPIFTDVMSFAIGEFAKDFDWAVQKVDNLINDILLPVFELTKTVFTDMCNSLKTEWDRSGGTLLAKFGEFRNSFKEIWDTLYNTIIKPVWDAFIQGIDTLWDEHLKPLWDSLVGFFSKLGEAVMTVWNNFLAPLIQWIIDVFGPNFVATFQNIWDRSKAVIGNMIDIVRNILDALGGLLDFVTGVFSGDWKKAWEGIKTFFKGIWDAMVNVIKAPINIIIGFINTLLNGITSGVNTAIRALNKLSFTVPDWVPSIGGKRWGFNISQLSTPKIPYLANGAIIDQPTLAMVGERGKEAVVPLENTAFADAIANAILRVLTPLFANGSSIGKNNDGTTVIVLKVGEYELGRITVGAINKYHNVIGKVELEV
jgi:phage-related protein